MIKKRLNNHLKENELVSIIIPTYNRARKLLRAVKSVTDQSYTYFELIIVDDCSSDNTSQIISKLDDTRIKYIRLSQNRGANYARNVGIKASRGKFIAFLDSDDEWLPEKIEMQISAFSELNNKFGVIYTSFFYISEVKDKHMLKNIANYMKNKRKMKKSGQLFADLLSFNYVGTTSTIMVRRSALEKIGSFDITLPSCQDWDLWLRLAKNFHFKKIEIPLVKYYLSKDSITMNYVSKIEGYEIIVRKYKKYFKKKQLANHYYILSLYNNEINKFEKSLKYILKSMKITLMEAKYYLNVIGIFVKMVKKIFLKN